MDSRELLKLIKSRRSIRKFKSDKLDYNDLLELVEAGTFAPSGSNTQCYRFRIIQDSNEMNFLGEHKLKWIANAPNAILVYADLSKCPYLKTKRSNVFDKLPYQDCAMAMQNICLLAEAKSIGQCVIQLSDTWPTANKIKEHFNLSQSDELMGIIVLGYPDEAVNYEIANHAGRNVKRQNVEFYLR